MKAGSRTEGEGNRRLGVAHQSGISRPFVRWPGGKRALVHELVRWSPRSFGTYYEPFLGSGALFFHLQPVSAVLGDSNAELINTYAVVRDDVERLIAGLSQLPQSARAFYAIRESRPSNPLARAIRFLYLNRTAFNGIWRVNGAGEFNVPYGYRLRRDLVAPESLRAASAALQGVALRVGDFVESLGGARRGDFLYVDPPYTAKHDDNGFRRYNEVLFSWNDQVRLSQLLLRLASRGIHIIVSNAHNAEVRKLYREGFIQHSITRRSLLSSNPEGRGQVTESVFVSKHTRR